MQDDGLLLQRLAQLVVNDAVVVTTDTTWKTAAGPILESDMIMGESYDARRELPGWNKPAFTTRGQWQSWLVLAPASGTWNFTVQAKGTAAWDLEVDSVRVGGGAQGDSTSASPCSVRLVKGQHGVRFRAGGPLTLDSITATSTQK